MNFEHHSVSVTVTKTAIIYRTQRHFLSDICFDEGVEKTGNMGKKALWQD